MTTKATRSIDEATVLWKGSSLATRGLLAYCRLLPQFRGKRALFEKAAALLFGGVLRVENDRGTRLRIDPADYIGRMIAFKGSFEPKSLTLALELMRPGGVFVDLGCNFGFYTLAVGGLAGARCVAVDASFVALARFQENLQENPGIDITLISCALAANPGLQYFELAEEGNLGSTRVAPGLGHQHAFRFWSAGASLQEVLARVDVRNVRLLKIDVEGFELAVFNGLNFDGPFRPENLIVECDLNQFPEAAAAIQHLVERGYEALTVDGEPVRNFHQLPENNVWCRDLRKRSDAAAPLPATAKSLTHA